jgi:hypothetical protein
MSISDIPIAFVSVGECAGPNILATINSCRGTKFSTLQNKPFTSQIKEISIVSSVVENLGGFTLLYTNN